MEKHKSLTQALLLAASGEQQEGELFYRGFINGPLFVPKRHQAQSLSDAPLYPSDLVYILGIQDSERVVAPVFTEPHFISEWCGLELDFSEFSGERFVTAVPEGWWAIINPGQEISKELSPWELSKLSRVGDIPELLEELYSSSSPETLEIAPVSEADYPKVFQALLSAIKEDKTVLRATLLQEGGAERLLLGVKIASNGHSPAQQREHFQKSLSDRIAPSLIGEHPVEIVVYFDGESAPLPQLFETYGAIYEVKEGKAPPH